MNAIVVLGAPLTPSGGLTEVLAERVAAAIELQATTGIALVIASGGVTRGAPRAEAAAIAEALPFPVVVEDRSRSTAENARFTAAILSARGVREAWLVTHAFHARRARYLFEREGIAARVHIAATGADRMRRWRWRLRETAAWAKLWADRLRR